MELDDLKSPVQSPRFSQEGGGRGSVSARRGDSSRGQSGPASPPPGQECGSPLDAGRARSRFLELPEGISTTDPF